MAQAGLGSARAQAMALGDSYHQCSTDKYSILRECTEYGNVQKCTCFHSGLWTSMTSRDIAFFASLLHLRSACDATTVIDDRKFVLSIHILVDRIFFFAHHLSRFIKFTDPEFMVHGDIERRYERWGDTTHYDPFSSFCNQNTGSRKHSLQS